MITTTDFGTLCDGRTVRLYTLKNDAIELSVTDYGSTLVRLLVPDKNGKPTDVVLGYDDLAGYVADDTCFGSTVVHLPRISKHSGYGRNIDDPAASLL